MDDLGRYIKILMFPTIVYTIVGLLQGSNNTSSVLVNPPSGGALSYVSWLLDAIGSIIASALQAMTFPMLPGALRVVFTLVFGAMFVYGLVGLIAAIIKIVKPL